MATHSIILAWEVPWTGGWQATVHGVAKDLDTTWQTTPVSLPGISHGPRSLVGCSSQGHKESSTTEQLRDRLETKRQQ